MPRPQVGPEGRVYTEGVSLGRWAGCVGVVLTSWALVSICACSDLGVDPFNKGGGSASASAAAVPAAPAPGVEITSPTRASFLVPGPVAVEGRATPAPEDGVPIRAVRLNGQSVPVQPDGTFQGTLQLVPFINVIQAVAEDERGRVGNCSIGVMAGDFEKPGTPVDQALRARFNETSFDAIARLVESIAWATDLQVLTQTPIIEPALWSFVTINLLNPRFHDVAARLDAKPSGLWVTATILRPYLEVDATFDLGVGGATIGPEHGVIDADFAEVTGQVLLTKLPDGRIEMTVPHISANFQNLRIQTASTLINLIEALLRDEIRKAIEKLVTDAVDRSRPDIRHALDETFMPPQPIQILDKFFAYEAKAETMSFDDLGFEMSLSVDTPLVNPTAKGLAAPGSIVTPGGPPPFQGPEGIRIALDDDTLNRVLFSMWANGVFEVDLDPAFLVANQITLPNGLPVAADLKQILPELGNAIPDNATLTAKISAGLPPAIEVLGTPDLLQFHLGELTIEVLVDRGQGPETLFELVLHLSVGATVEMTSAGLQFESNQNASFSTDITKQPIVRIDERRIQVALGIVVIPLLPHVINELPVIPIPHVGALNFFNFQASDDGPEREHLHMTVEMSR